MSTLSTRIDRARTSNWIDDIQYTDTRAVQDANIIIHQIEDFITSAIWEWFFWDIMTASTTVIDQSEYKLPIISSWNFNSAKKIEAISICYKDWWEFIPARQVNRQILQEEHDLSRYETNQSETDPIYFIADDSYFIYPAPKEAVEDWIKLYWIKWLADAELTTTNDNLFWWKIPTKYYYMISEWMEQFILKVQWKRNEAKNSKDFFEKTILPSLVDKLWNRKSWISKRWDLVINI